MADEFDRMASAFVRHPDYRPTPKPPPLGVLAKRVTPVPCKQPEASSRRSSLQRAGGAAPGHTAGSSSTIQSAASSPCR